MWNCVALVLLGAFTSICVRAQLYEGSECFVQRIQKQGTCKIMSSCPWAKDEVVKYKRYPQICGWAGTLPIVCCPSSSGGSSGGNNGWSNVGEPTRSPKPKPQSTPTRRPPTSQQTGRIAREKCKEYGRYVWGEIEEPVALSEIASTGERRTNYCAYDADPFIVGGQEAKLKEFPHMALIGFGPKDNIDYLCGGSLISPNFVMTAAHCLFAPDNRPASWVLLGEYDRSTETEDTVTQLIAIKEKIRHENYKPPQQYNDIALLKLQRNAEFNAYVRPACVLTTRQISPPDGTSSGPVATGWGHTEWGDSCFYERTHVPGKCKKLPHCSIALDQIKRREGKPQICSFTSSNYPIVCCPCSGSSCPTPAPPKKDTHHHPVELTSRGPGRIARRKCLEYSKFVYKQVQDVLLSMSSEKELSEDTCGQSSPETLIIGGTQADGKEFPHMALLGYGGERSTIAWLCAGSLISERWVLTAAHCLVNAEGQPVDWVLLGERDTSNPFDDVRSDEKPQILAVLDRVRHPEYNPPAKYNDIALLKLEEEAEFDEFVRPACVHHEEIVRNPHQVQASGWGHTEWAGDPSSVLMKVTLNLTKNDECVKAFSDTSKRQLPTGIATSSQLCAGGNGKDTCQGDSGGPLQVSTQKSATIIDKAEPYCMYYIIGITSFGKFCGFNSPAVYTRVFHYVDWIERHVWPNQ